MNTTMTTRPLILSPIEKPYVFVSTVHPSISHRVQQSSAPPPRMVSGVTAIQHQLPMSRPIASITPMTPMRTSRAHVPTNIRAMTTPPKPSVTAATIRALPIFSSPAVNIVPASNSIMGTRGVTFNRSTSTTTIDSSILSVATGNLVAPVAIGNPVSVGIGNPVPVTTSVNVISNVSAVPPPPGVTRLEPPIARIRPSLQVCVTFIHYY